MEEVNGDQFGDINTPKFKEGDKVRIEKYKKRFAKGYEKTFTDEVFTIKEVTVGDPTVYKLEDTGKEEIIGTFYEEELVLATSVSARSVSATSVSARSRG